MTYNSRIASLTICVAALTAATLPANEPPLAAEHEDLGISIQDLDGMASSWLPGELGLLPETPVAADNPLTPEKIDLGRHLYFDNRLSMDNSMSCATCHHPDHGWADPRPRSLGFGGLELGRHSPTVINTAFNGPQFWDGRAHGLEEQATGPIMSGAEMNMPSPEEVTRRVKLAPEYKGKFEEVFGEAATLENIGRAIAAFERTVVSRDSKFDEYVGGDASALTDQEKRGLIVYVTKASCTACHSGKNFTDNKFHNLGVAQEGPLAEDLGRFEVTKDEKDRGAFKTPTLRNIAQTAPYMHDGSLATLEEVVEFYNKGGGDKPGKSDLVKPLNLTESQKSDLVAFLKALTGSTPKVEIPEYQPLPEEEDKLASGG
ncbi:Cytochrome c551 peroxidase precursor [Posidoniimonas corsicana]|uniref:Methylamine utilization protein MauG n=1 Tax=Posidoniimonas corsicana TaxID=1938618 RepID=A0A5C5VD77_9BACT|nr:cytochrome c peroxidase [Posidoniimonas corsicana]TWT36556.1 Cytochrome c551 peroxidase precursor [Posidoniimonas corsicana]